MIASLLIFLIQNMRPVLFGPAACLFVPSCSQFACIQLKEKSLFRACILIGKRLISCNPFTN